MEKYIIYMPIVAAIIGLIYMVIKKGWVMKQDAGDGKMKEISDHIYEGALAFLKAEYKLLTYFVIGVSILLAVVAYFIPSTSYLIVVAFIFGAFFSAYAGNMGMKIATKTNVRTTQAARTSLPDALKISFGGGTVMGLGVAGLAVLGLTTFFIVFFKLFMPDGWTNTTDMTMILETLAGFSLGAESIALFARVGGGIYTKAADVGADLVGKVEAGIPEDDPRNPATIADNVGDNVGDVAGMGADLFGSYVATVLAAMVLGNYIIDVNNIDIFNGFGHIGPILLPMAIAGVGIIISLLGTMLVSIKSNDAKESEVMGALNKGNWFSIALVAVSCYGLVTWMLPETMKMNFFESEGNILKDISSMRVFYATLVGLVVGAVISSVTEYYTGLGKKPILNIVEKSATGAGTNIIAGLATGMISTFPTIILFASAIWASYAFAGFYGVAMAASAMMATTAMQLAIDAFGPIADNAGGIAEMSEQDPIVRERTDILDTVGNTTAATGKGFAIASAALTSLALFAAYVTFTGIDGINIFKAPVLAMLFVGAMVPVVFSALAMNAVGKAAMEMVYEVRRQFKEIPGIMEGTGKPEYDKCVEISTKASLKEMMLPGVLTIGFPLVITFLPMLFGMDNLMIAEMLGGYMAGVTVSGVLWAIFQNNAGGAWDNAKKSFEAGVMINGKMTHKGSDAHEAAITGDTVGDPFKDTSGPSMNILIKLTCLIGLVIAPILGGHSIDSDKSNHPDTTKKTENTISAIPANKKGGEVIKDGTHLINKSLSVINWKGQKIVGDNHTGTINISEGKLNYENGELVDGKISIDMTTISSNLKDPKEKKDLDGHLSGKDFFNTNKFPEAYITIKESKFKGNKGEVSGELIIKGIDQPYRAKIIRTNKSAKAIVYEGSLDFDRTKYGIEYKSGNIFKELGDKAIDDIITVKFTFVVEK